MNEMKTDLWHLYDKDSAAQAFARHKAEVEALPEERWEKVQVPADMTTILDAGLVLYTQANADRALLLSKSSLDAAELDAFPTLRLALWYASVELSLTQPESKKQQLTDLVKQLRMLRQQLFGGIDLVWPGHEAMQKRLAELQRGKGYADLANDVLGLVTLYRGHIQEASAWIHSEKLQAALDEGARLSPLLLDVRNTEGTTTEIEKKALMQRRIYALFAHIFDEIAAAGAYVHRHDPETREAYINLRTAYIRGRQENKSESKDEDGSQDPPIPQDPPTPQDPPIPQDPPPMS